MVVMELNRYYNQVKRRRGRLNCHWKGMSGDDEEKMGIYGCCKED